MSELPVNSVIMAGRTDQTHEGAMNEPLVLDFAAMHDEHNAQEHTPPLTPTSPAQTIIHEPQTSWLSYEDQDSTAPAPPDFTRRGIHIPTRTR
jgi:hypothetical protein